MIVLGIESSCDDCSISLVEDGFKVLSLKTSSQVEAHKPFYGVVPEIASRLHAQSIDIIFRESLKEAQLRSDQIDVIAVTNRPGLVGSLTVGVSFAKGLAMSLNKPLVGIDHIKAHLYSPFLDNPTKLVKFPLLCLLVSGGHTLLAKQNSLEDIEILGTTLDDACGEAFDKVAKYYDLGFPGGPFIDKIAQEGDEDAYKFPIANTAKIKGEISLDFSFSGLKTAVIHQKEKFLKIGKEDSMKNLVASFQKTAIDSLLINLEKAIELTGIKNIVIAGGVASNSYLRKSMQSLCSRLELEYLIPPLKYCTDNGAMVGGLGYHTFLEKGGDSLNLEVSSRVSSYKYYKHVKGDLKYE